MFGKCLDGCIKYCGRQLRWRTASVDIPNNKPQLQTEYLLGHGKKSIGMVRKR